MLSFGHTYTATTPTSSALQPGGPVYLLTQSRTTVAAGNLTKVRGMLTLNSCPSPTFIASLSFMARGRLHCTYQAKGGEYSWTKNASSYQHEAWSKGEARATPLMDPFNPQHGKLGI